MHPLMRKGAIAILGLCTACGGFSAAVQAAETACPVSSGGQTLATIELYDGPVEDNVVLAPDTTTGTATKGTAKWTVGSIYREGRHLTVACHYRPGTTQQVVEIVKPVKTCSQVLDSKAGGSFACR